MRIRLVYDTKYDSEFLSAGVSLRIVRLYANVRLKTLGGWTAIYQAIIDTGSPIALVPFSIWAPAESKPLVATKTRLFGLGSGSVSGQLAELTLQFVDEESTSPSVVIKAHLLDDDSTPFIIGFEDALTHIDLFSSYNAQAAYLEL